MMSFHYGALQALYWMLFGAINGFVTVYLLGQGLDESIIGLLIAASNTVAALIQPLLAGWIDRTSRFRLKDIGLAVALGIGLLLALSLSVPAVSIVGFLLATVLIWALQPIVNSVAIYYLNRGDRLNFGTARAAGSGFYALMSFIVGYLIIRHGVSVIPIAGLVMSGLIGLTFSLFVMEHTADTVDPYKYVEKRVGFWREQRFFVLFLIGIILLFTFHTCATTYLIQIVERIGGDASTMGTAAAVMAIVEIPVLIFSNQLIKRFGANKLLIFAAFFWVIKALGIMLAPTIPLLYLVFLTQALCYAPLIPASVHYTNQVMRPGEKVFGQALVTAAFTIGGVVGSLLGGLIISYLGVYPMMLSGVIITLIGWLIITLAIRCQTKREQPDLPR